MSRGCCGTGRSTPLGAFTRPAAPGRRRGCGCSEGDRILLYTDGLVERRDRALDEGLRLLQRGGAAQRPDAAAGGGGAAAHADHAAGREHPRRRLRAAARVERRRSSSGSVPRRPEHAVGRPVGARAAGSPAHGVDHDTRPDVVLAASEALANAAEHGGCAATPTDVRVPRAVVDRRADGRGRRRGDRAATAAGGVTPTRSPRPRARSADHPGAGRRHLVRHDEGTTVGPPQRRCGRDRHDLRRRCAPTATGVTVLRATR